jgi:Flp pilus assembly protein TadG
MARPKDVGIARRLIRRFRSDRGQALVELAFVLPLVMLILFGIIDFGLALNNYNSDTNLANLAARTASVMGTTTSIGCGTQTDTTLKAFVVCEAAATGAPTPTYVCFGDTSGATPSGTLTTAGDSLEVKVQSTFGWLKILTGGNSYVKGMNLNSTISASATMRLEQVSTTTNPFFNTTSTPVCTS